MTAIEQERLVRVGPGTPMGTLLRRYWFPIAAESALRETGRLKVRLLGEDLVLFRTLDGHLGLLDDRCPHRGTSLSRGCVTPFGLRCAYHGWHFDHDGRCIELPGERTPGHVASQVRTPAYRAQSLGGLVFAYLGPEPAPLLPRYDLFVDTGVLRDIGQALVPCNWLQIMENSVDPHHVEWLHGEQLGLERARRGLPPPRYYGKRHQKVGFDLFRHGIIKRRVLIGGSEEDDDWKIGHPLIFPVTLRVGSRGAATFQIRVPVDDTTTWHVWYSCFAAPPELPAQKEIPYYEVPFRDARGEPITDFIDGQDIMVWTSQGAIADRTREKLVETDAGLIFLRRLLLQQLERIETGADPIGIVRDLAENQRIELPQEDNKYGGGTAFSLEYLELGHFRHSPIREALRQLFA